MEKYENPKSLLCENCENTFEDPFRTNCCEITYCEKCVKLMEKEEKVCKKCKKSIIFADCVRNTVIDDVLKRMRPPILMNNITADANEYPHLMTKLSQKTQQNILKSLIDDIDHVAFFVQFKEKRFIKIQQHGDITLNADELKFKTIPKFERGYKCPANMKIVAFKKLMFKKFGIDPERNHTEIHFYYLGEKLNDNMTFRTIAYSANDVNLRKLIIEMRFLRKEGPPKKDKSAEGAEAMEDEPMPSLSAEEPRDEDVTIIERPPPQPAPAPIAGLMRVGKAPQQGVFINGPGGMRLQYLGTPMTVEQHKQHLAIQQQQHQYQQQHHQQQRIFMMQPNSNRQPHQIMVLKAPPSLAQPIQAPRGSGSSLGSQQSSSSGSPQNGAEAKSSSSSSNSPPQQASGSSGGPTGITPAMMITKVKTMPNRVSNPLPGLMTVEPPQLLDAERNRIIIKHTQLHGEPPKINQGAITRAVEYYFLRAYHSKIEPTQFLDDYFSTANGPPANVKLTPTELNKYAVRQHFDQNGVLIPPLTPEIQLSVYRQMLEKMPMSQIQAAAAIGGLGGPMGPPPAKKRKSAPMTTAMFEQYQKEQAELKKQKELARLQKQQQKRAADEKRMQQRMALDANLAAAVEERRQIRKSDVSAYVSSVPLVKKDGGAAGPAAAPPAGHAGPAEKEIVREVILQREPSSSSSTAQTAQKEQKEQKPVAAAKEPTPSASTSSSSFSKIAPAPTSVPVAPSAVPAVTINPEMIDALTLSRQCAKPLGKTLAESMRRSGNGGVSSSSSSASAAAAASARSTMLIYPRTPPTIPPQATSAAVAAALPKLFT